MSKNKTSIIVACSTRNELRRVGRKGQTIDQVIKELLEIKQNRKYDEKKSDFPDSQSWDQSSRESQYS